MLSDPQRDPLPPSYYFSNSHSKSSYTEVSSKVLDSTQAEIELGPGAKYVLRANCELADDPRTALNLLGTVFTEGESPVAYCFPAVNLAEAIETCVNAGDEHRGMDLLQQFDGVLPLHVVHRAGERGMLSLLRGMYARQTAVSSGKTVSKAKTVLLSLIHKRAKPAKREQTRDRITTEELLKWACVTQHRDTVR